MDRDINILAISDIHVGCPRLNPRQLHERFVKYLYPQITKEIDILFICGDFFDSLLNLNSLASLEAIEIIRELKDICRTNECDLRILRGTFTHDRDQPQHFVNGEDPNDKTVQLFKTVDVEYNERTGLNILYIPDNVPTKDIYADVRTLLAAHNLEKVDIMIHHGYFKHMLPPNIQEPHGCLDVDIVSKFVKGCVLNGHVHLTSIHRNVISVGSFDRMTHNEEGPKGFYKIHIDKEGVYHFSFIENKDANKFLSFDMRTFGNMASEAIAFFTKKWTTIVPTFKDGEFIHIGFISDDLGIIEGCSQVAREHFPEVIIDKVNTVKRAQILENVNMGLSELPVITEANLAELLLPLVQKKSPVYNLQDVQDVLAVCKDPKKE